MIWDEEKQKDFSGALNAAIVEENRQGLQGPIFMLEELRYEQGHHPVDVLRLIDSLCSVICDAMTTQHKTCAVNEDMLKAEQMVACNLIRTTLELCPTWGDDGARVSFSALSAWHGAVVSNIGINFVGFLGICTSAVKKGLEAKIRKFLQSVLSSASQIDRDSSANLDKWSSVEREMLAAALVHNHLYNECVHHRILEAIDELVTLACYRITEPGGALRRMGLKEETVASLPYLEAALEKPHEWSVLTQLLIKSGEVKLITTLDQSGGEPRMRNAICFTRDLPSLSPSS